MAKRDACFVRHKYCDPSGSNYGCQFLNWDFLFRWLDKLKCEKCVHPITLAEISRHKDERVRKSFETKLQSYVVLKSVAPQVPALSSLSASLDKTDNDRNDLALLNELVSGRVDAIISEDLGVHNKATLLLVSDGVYSIDSFLEEVTAENPELTDYKVLSVKKRAFWQR